MSDEFLDTLNRILRYGQFNNSYKFALMRALAAYGADHSSTGLLISTKWLAEKFAEFYWSLEVRFHLRQATVPNKNPVIMRLIKTEAQQLGLPGECTFSQYINNHEKRAAKLIGTISRETFKDVIPRFHKIRGIETLNAPLFEGLKDNIRLTEASRYFLERHWRVVELLAIGGWAKFTEQYSSAPRLFEKIEGSAKRKNLSKYRKYLLTLHDGQCFYCGNNLEQEFHIDHFIPWVFVAEDRLWNLVPTCPTCNSTKSSSLPKPKLLVAICARNSGIGAGINIPPIPRKDMSEWSSKEALEVHLRSLYSRCEAEGFSIWAPAVTSA